MVSDLCAFNLYIPYALLALSLVLCWVSQRVALTFFFGFLASGFWFGVLQKEAFGIVPVLLGCVVILRYSSSKAFKFLAHLAFFSLAFLLFFHKLPGFNNFKVFHEVQTSAACAPFSMYLNAEGGIIAFILLNTLIPLSHSAKDWKQIIMQSLFYLGLCVLTLIALATFIDYVKFDPKIPSEACLFALNNLLLVCIAEEAFFRGYLQKYMSSFCTRYQFPKVFALLGASLFFGLRHINGGIPFVALSAVAGLFYGAVYMKTGRIEASILTHFGLNLTHFLFFSYPFVLL